MNSVTFVNCDLEGSDFFGVTGILSFRDCNLNSVDFSSSDMRRWSFTRCKEMQECKFDNAILGSLSGIDLSGSSFRCASTADCKNFSNTNFSNCYLAGIYFPSACRITGAKFDGANLTNATFFPKLSEISFRSCILVRTTFGEVQNSDFTSAKIERTTFKRAVKCNFTK
jgi:uncharacterized protein YjbI with pentapeptide repeats